MTKSHYFSAFLVVILIIIDLQLRLLIPFGTAQEPSVSISPAEGNAGTTMDVVITGVETGFNENTTVSFSCEDITVNSVTVNSATELISNISIAATTGCLNGDRLASLSVDENGDTSIVYEQLSGFQINNTIIPVDIQTNFLFGSIALALLDANDGDTIQVNDGDYLEDIIIDKQVSVVSVNGKDVTSITGEDCNDTDYLNIVTMSHDNAQIEGFALVQPGDCLYHGLSADGFNNLTITDMDIDGGFGKGMVLANSSGSTISNSLISGNEVGIDLTNTQDITINNNTIIGNSTGGVVNNSLTLANLVLAKNNWWNNATGPQNSISNAAGGGDTVSDGVVFSPWCADTSCATYDWLTLNASDLPNLFTIAESYNNGWILRADDVSPPADYVTSFVTAIQKFEVTIPTGSSNSVVLVPQGTTITAVDSSNFDPSELSAVSAATSTVSGLSGMLVGYVLRFGLPAVGLSADQAISFSLFVGTGLTGTYNLYHSVSASTGWGTTGLGATTCTVASGLCSFTSTRASYFAAVDPNQTPPEPPQEEATTTPEEEEEEEATTTPEIATPSGGGYELSIYINNGAAKTKTEKVNLTLFGGPDADTMMISDNLAFTGAKQIKYSTTASSTLSGGNGKKIIYVKFFNSAGVVLGMASASIILEKAEEEVKKPEIKKPALPGDFSADGKIDVLDFNLLMVEWSKLKSVADFNRDGVVNIADLNELMIVWPI